jgi:hypothetical protein
MYLQWSPFQNFSPCEAKAAFDSLIGYFIHVKEMSSEYINHTDFILGHTVLVPLSAHQHIVS